MLMGHLSMDVKPQFLESPVLLQLETSTIKVFKI
jgi:hypothetical protein